MADIVLATLNAKYIHAAFGLRYLAANLGENASRSALLEFDINMRPADIAERILAEDPQIVGLGVYIWNVAQSNAVVQILKKVRPIITVILGGPEVSYETTNQPIVHHADFVICGEADLAFADLCKRLLADQRPSEKIIAAPPPEFDRLHLPYSLYTDADLAHRVIYVEASRGCPFTCEFCLSSLDIPVRRAPREALLSALGTLLDRGARQLKFVDRTFNLNLNESLAVLDFLWERYQPGHFFHFEVVPDRLPTELREAISRFPPGALQLEAGVQTFNEEAARRISRRQDYHRLEENLEFLRTRTGAHIHADLIAGLPGETLESFAAGFDRLVALGPHEIQVGILKRLKGTPISRHDTEWEMVYSPDPPFEILQNKLLRFEEIQRLKRFARYWDLVANSGNFIETTPRIWQTNIADSAEKLLSEPSPGPFQSFLRFSDWLFQRFGKTDSIALPRLMEGLHFYLTSELRQDPEDCALSLWRDYQRAGRRDKPEFLRQYALPEPNKATASSTTLPKRQARRLPGQNGITCEKPKQH